MVSNNLYNVIEGENGKPLVKEIKKTKKLYQCDDYVIAVLSALYDTMYQQIHGYLAPLDNCGKAKSSVAEKEIRTHISFIAKDVLPLIEKKFETIGAESKKLYDTKKSNGERYKKLQGYYKEYERLYDGYFALVAFRSLKHYALYIEQDFAEKVVEPAMDCFSGYWYYANKMIIDNSVQFIEKQCPTGYGKSVSDLLTMAFLYGYDIDNDVIKVTGARGNIIREFDSVIGFLCSNRHAKVFPYFADFNGERDKVFDMCAVSQGSFKIHGSKRSKNLFMVSKEVKINGERAKYLFLDDITQAEDAGNNRAHDEDIYKFNNVWFKRNYNLNDFHIVIGGTTYSEYDILSYIKGKYNAERAVASNINKYTKVAKSDTMVDNGTSVFVVVPKLDYETDKSTYPSKFPTIQARKMRDEDERTFLAMEQQTPLPPENSPFYWDNIQTYEVLPPIGECGRTECCYAALDPARKGKNYVAMPIFSAFNDKHYLIDFMYELKTMDCVYHTIVQKVLQHHITLLVVENNTDTSLRALLNKMFKEHGIDFCKIVETYSTGEKEVRIFNQDTLIKNRIVFPAKQLYARSSQMGTAMLHIVSFSYKGKNEYDDSIDAVALYAQNVISGKTGKAKMTFIDLSR